MAATLLTGYYAALEHHYLMTSACQSFGLMGIGDCIAQSIEINAQQPENHLVDQTCRVVEDERPSTSYDPMRTLRVAMIGMFINGPVSYTHLTLPTKA